MGDAYIESLAAYSATELEFLVKYHEKQIDVVRGEIAKLSPAARSE